jgi:hypothetical protein
LEFDDFQFEHVLLFKEFELRRRHLSQARPTTWSIAWTIDQVPAKNFAAKASIDRVFGYKQCTERKQVHSSFLSGK